MKRSKVLVQRVASPDQSAVAIAKSVAVVSEAGSDEHSSPDVSAVHQTTIVHVASGAHSSSSASSSSASV